MTTSDAVDHDKFGTMLEAAMELRPEEKRIVADLDNAVKAGQAAFEKWGETEQSLWYEKHVQEHDRVVELMTQITNSDYRPEVLLQAEKVFIIAGRDRYKKEAEADGPLNHEASASLAEREMGLAEAALAERLLGIRRLPPAYQAHSAIFWPNFRFQAAPWEDQVTKYCSFELAHLNGHYPFWGGGLSSAHAIREIMILRREALHKFIRLYLEFRNKEALVRDIQMDEVLEPPLDDIAGNRDKARERLDMKPALGAADLSDEIADEIIILFDAYAQIGRENMTSPEAENTDGEYDRPWLLPEQQSVFLGDLMKIIKRLK